MNQERATIQVTTPNGRTAVFNEWITVNEYREIMSIYLEASKGVSVDTKSEQATVTSSEAATVGMRAQDRAIELVVVEYDGSRESILERVKNSRLEDGQFIIDKVEEITSPKKK